MTATANIELLLPEEGIDALALSFIRQGISPFMSSLFVASRPFEFTGDASVGDYTVRNLESGAVTEMYSGATEKMAIVEGDIFCFMDNGDILNVSKTMRTLANAVCQRMIVLGNSQA